MVAPHPIMQIAMGYDCSAGGNSRGRDGSENCNWGNMGDYAMGSGCTGYDLAVAMRDDCNSLLQCRWEGMCTAAGAYAVAMGYDCSAIGNFSFADGSGCTAWDAYTVAFGNGADASGTCGFMYRDMCGNEFCFDSSGVGSQAAVAF